MPQGMQKSRAARVLAAAVVAALLSFSASPAATAASPQQASEVGDASHFGNYLAGRFADSQQDHLAAAKFLGRALEHDPDNVALLNRTFVLTAANGDLAGATKLAKRLVSLDPEHGMANLILAVDQVLAGELGPARNILQSLPSRGLNSIIVPMMQAWLLVDSNVDGAMNAIDNLKDSSGFETFYNLHRALMFDVSGATEEALAAYTAALTANEQPSLRLVWLAGNFFERTGKREEARQLYADFLSRNPGTTLLDPALKRLANDGVPQPEISTSQHGIAEVMFNMASLLSQERVDVIGLLHGHLALQLRPDFAVAQVLLGETLESQQRRQEAIAVYKQVSEASPFAWLVRMRIADGLDQLDQTDEAITVLDDLAERRPDRFEPYFRIGNLLRTKERFAEAVGYYDKAVDRVSTIEKRHWSLLYFRGIALERAGQWHRAESDFLQALELQPEQPYVMNYLAYSWVEQKIHLEKARSMLIRAVELRPDDGYIVDSLGWVHYRFGEYSDAVKHLERAVELRPQDPVINDHLGDAYWRVGRRAEARFQWRRALSLKPEEDLVPTIEGKIDIGLDTELNDT